MNYVFAKRLEESSANFRNKNYYTENELDIFTCSLVRKMRWLNEKKNTSITSNRESVILYLYNFKFTGLEEWTMKNL